MAPVESYDKIFISDSLKSDQFETFALAGDASMRRYYRVVLNEKSWVLMKWEPFDPKRYPFLSVQKHFHKNGIRVPEVIDCAPKLGLMLLEDLGDLTLERKFWENQDQNLVMDFYQQSIQELLKIHYTATRDKSDCIAFQIEFNTEKLLWELNYAKKNFLQELSGLKLSRKIEAKIDKIFLDIADRLAALPQVICHRDFHSRNLMIKLGKVNVIDFQDARMGPMQYDLVSLLKDSYVKLDEENQQKLIYYYLEKRKDFESQEVDLEKFMIHYELQSIQRCFKAAGSFASFYVTRGDTRYLKYLKPTLRYVQKSLMHFPEYKDFLSLLLDNDLINREYKVS